MRGLSATAELLVWMCSGERKIRVFIRVRQVTALSGITNVDGAAIAYVRALLSLCRLFLPSYFLILKAVESISI